MYIAFDVEHLKLGLVWLSRVITARGLSLYEVLQVGPTVVYM